MRAPFPESNTKTKQKKIKSASHLSFSSFWFVRITISMARLMNVEKTMKGFRKSFLSSVRWWHQRKFAFHSSDLNLRLKKIQRWKLKNTATLRLMTLEKTNRKWKRKCPLHYQEWSFSTSPRRRGMNASVVIIATVRGFNLNFIAMHICGFQFTFCHHFGRGRPKSQVFTE